MNMTKQRTEHPLDGVESEELEVTCKLTAISVPMGSEIAEDGSSTAVSETPNSVKTKGIASGSSAKRGTRQLWSKDRWLLATFVVACVASVASTLYFFQNHQILLIGDTYSHLLIARRLFDNLTPGVAQLGGIWLPLPHLLMLPFIWNDYLWHTGLAGSAVGMGCYMVTAIYIFLTVKRLTKSSCASFIGSIVFILNPNILYLQSTPLTEPVCWATY